MKARNRIIVLGGGLTGLSAAYHLQELGVGGVVVVERNDRVGGLARTERHGGFSFDHSIHILYTSNRYAAGLIRELLGNDMIAQARRAYCYSCGVYTEYPYQANNYGLPPEVVVENVVGLMKAHIRSDGSPDNFEEWIFHTFGNGIARNFMIPYNRQVWAWDLQEMSFDWIAERVPRPSIKDVLLGALRPPDKTYGPNREFWYPQVGGIEELPTRLSSQLPDDAIRLDCQAVGLDVARRVLTLRGGDELGYDQLISTIPLPTLVGMIAGEGVPGDVRQAVAGLKHNTVHTVNLGLRGHGLGQQPKMHWVYYPEETTVFHRLSFPHHFSPSMVPPGCCSIQAEVSESEYRPRQCPDLIAQTLRDLVKVGLLSADQARPESAGGRVVVASQTTLDPAYVIYGHEHRRDTTRVLSYLESLDILSHGRFGEWEYFNMDHSILSGRRAAERVAARCEERVESNRASDHAGAAGTSTRGEA